MKAKKPDARTFGQDLMKGENPKFPAGTIPAGLVYGEMTAYDGADRTITGTSIFDPTLCELMYRWFAPPGGLVLDPFAGGSVRGIIASKLGRQYIGLDIRQEQIDANKKQADEICEDPMPVWVLGDSRQIDKICEDVQADFLFS
jgi:tRNA G10  N-methylase Trm11